MNRLDDRLRAAAEDAERAALSRQYTGLAGTGADPAVLGTLQLVADAVRDAARALGPDPVAAAGVVRQAVFSAGVSAVLFTVGILAVPHPAEPWVLALIVTGASVPGVPLWGALTAFRSRRAAPDPPRSLPETIAGVRAAVTAVVAELEPDRRDSHLRAGRRLETARVWLDAAELEADHGGALREYRHRFTTDQQ